MAHFALPLIMIYIQFISNIYGGEAYATEYITIYADSMKSSTVWSMSSDPSEVTFGYESSGCSTGTCCKLRASDGTDAYIYRSYDTSSYGSLQLQFDLSGRELESDDACNVYYAYDSQAGKTLLQSYYAPDEEREFWDGQLFTLTGSKSVDTLWIWFEVNQADASGKDDCYVDNVYVKAMPGTSGTIDTCIDSGASLSLGHLCQCKDECEEAFCHPMTAVEKFLQETVDGSCESGTCCCSCDDCVGFKGYIGSLNIQTGF